MDATFLPSGNPVLTRELRVLLRNARTFALLAIYVSVLGAVVMSNFPGDRTVSFEGGRAEMGRGLFVTFFMAQLVLVLVLVPGLATGALAQERERRTLEPLLLTPMTPLGIVWGKAAGVLALTGLLLLSTLPLSSLCFLLGGVSPRRIDFGLRGFAGTGFVYDKSRSLLRLKMAVHHTSDGFMLLLFAGFTGADNHLRRTRNAGQRSSNFAVVFSAPCSLVAQQTRSAVAKIARPFVGTTFVDG